MAKRSKIIYWISTIWLALGMLSTGIVQLFKVKAGTVNEIFSSSLLLILTMVSWYFRPADRKIISVDQNESPKVNVYLGKV